MVQKKQKKTINTNRQAHRDFHIDRTYEAGLELLGNEVKSLRDGGANLKGSFARVENGELFLYNMHINPYKYSREECDPLRRRKLLLHKAEIKQLVVKSSQQGYTLVPLKIYFKRSYAKIEIGLARGKRQYDKRVALKEKQAKREITRTLRLRNK